MKKSTNIIESLALKLVLLIIVVLGFNSIEFQLTITKKKNSVISSVIDTVDGVYSTYKTVKRGL